MPTGESGRAVPLTTLAATLAFGTGALDVASFTRLGETFASVMTGNLVLLGLAAARASRELAIHTGVAFAGYCLGVILASPIAGRRDPHGPAWPRRVSLVLLVELSALAGFTTGWELTGSRPDGGTQLTLLAVAAFAMGLQAAAVRVLPEVLSTTYLTGTLTGVVADLTIGTQLRSAQRRGLAVLAGAGAGAATGGGLLIARPSALPVLPLAALVSVLVVATGARVRR